MLPISGNAFFKFSLLRYGEVVEISFFCAVRLCLNALFKISYAARCREREEFKFRPPEI